MLAKRMLIKEKIQESQALRQRLDGMLYTVQVKRIVKNSYPLLVNLSSIKKL